MAEQAVPRDPEPNAASPMTLRTAPWWYYLAWVVMAGLFAALYWGAFQRMRWNWNYMDSYYSHGPVIPLISLFFVWTKRKELLAAPIVPCGWGYALILGSCFAVIALGDFLSLGIFAELSIMTMLAGYVLVMMGTRHLKLVWFPIAFLFFMIPIPPSITQAVALKVKLAATEGAVQLSRLFGYPMIRDGSYVFFGDDKLLVGEICGGLRSLIALFAFGALMSHISKTRLWSKLAILFLSGPIAIIANTSRIFLLCIVGFYWGSETAAGKVHDISGVLIFVVAFILLFSMESLLRKIAPAKPDQTEPQPEEETPSC